MTSRGVVMTSRGVVMTSRGRVYSSSYHSGCSQFSDYCTVRESCCYDNILIKQTEIKMKYLLNKQEFSNM